MVDEPKETVNFGEPGPTLDDTVGGGGDIPRHRVVPGDNIGPFKILSTIGEGGFGVVFLAEQTSPVKRRVALKVIKAGMDTKAVVARFEAERQALALMNHPGISKVYEAGETEQGRPYFVMEYVKGESLSDYCDKHKLDTAQRLRLFARVCDAVQHAHQKGVIHRDLKPANILVTVNDRDEPQPKVIDFGIAKATAQQLTERTVFTQQGQMIGTPEYMSPEQAEMTTVDIDTRSDVYSLGVILYQLLTGKLPFDPHELRSKGYSEIQRIIREEDPPRPSTRLTTITRDPGQQLDSKAIAQARQTTIDSLSSVLRRELEWIPLKALRKDRTERYSSCESLARDVRRYLDGEPLEAGPLTNTYRMRKFIRRNKGSFTAACLITLSLLLGVVFSTLFAFEASRQRDRAVERLDGLRTLIGQMSGSINASVKNLQGGLEVRERMLDAAQGQLTLLRSEAESSGDPELLHAVGEAVVALGDLAGGERVASTGDVETALAHYRDAEAIYSDLRERQLELSKELRFTVLSMHPRIKTLQADVLLAAGREDEAVPLIIEARDLLRPLVASGDVSVRRQYNLALQNLGDIAAARGDHSAALAYYEEHYAAMERMLAEAEGGDPLLRRGAAITLRRVGYAQGELGLRDLATESLQRSLTVMLELSEDLPDDLRRRRDVGFARAFLGQHLLVGDAAEQDRGGTLFLESGRDLVAVCVAEPGVARYRTDVGNVIPDLHGQLVASGQLQRADRLRMDTLLALQPVLESSPDNLALNEVLALVRALSPTTTP